MEKITEAAYIPVGDKKVRAAIPINYLYFWGFLLVPWIL